MMLYESSVKTTIPREEIPRLAMGIVSRTILVSPNVRCGALLTSSDFALFPDSLMLSDDHTLESLTSELTRPLYLVRC